MIRIAFAGGGSGGHIFPIIAIARRLKELTKTEDKKIEFLFIGPADNFSQVLAAEDVRVASIAASKFRRYASFENVLDVIKFPFGVIGALWTLFWYMPDVLFSKGGPGSFQVVLAAWILRIPVIIHESDSVPGKANLFSAKFADRIGVAFTSAKSYFRQDITALVGNPLRLDSKKYAVSPDQLKEFGISPEKPYVLVLGGSQGAEKINTIVLATLNELLKFTQIIHQAGEAHVRAVERIAWETVSEKAGYKPVAFLEEKLLYGLLAGASLVVSRAGAGSIFEIAAFGKPSILIPIQNSANDHQRKNAQEYFTAGACRIIEEQNLTPHLFVAVVKEIFENVPLREKMGKAAAAFARPESADILAREIMLFARE